MPDFSDRFRGNGNGEERNDGFDDDFDEINDDFDDGFSDSPADEPSDAEQAGTRRMSADGNAGWGRRTKRNAGFGEKMAALSGSLASRFGSLLHGDGKPAGNAGMDRSDASFAGHYDSALDEGLITDSGAEQMNASSSRRRENMDDRREYADDRRENMEYRREYADDRDGQASEGPAGEEEMTGGLMAALGAALGKAFGNISRRLPGFRPKVYVPAEPVYRPEDDGIGSPTLSSDIRRMLEEQSRPGETEQEYDRMRSYISSVSTDTRIRPGDIRTPEKMEEVRAVQSEIDDLIHLISTTNEQQRSRIGVYDPPPEEDPYNYRGINDERQNYPEMDFASFEMAPSYGFETERKIDPAAEQARMAYDRMNEPPAAVSGLPPAPEPSFGTSDGSFDDGFDDDFDDGFDDDLDNGMDVAPEYDLDDRADSRSGAMEPFRDRAGAPSGTDDADSFDDGLDDDADGGAFDDGSFDDGLDDDADGDAFDDDFARGFVDRFSRNLEERTVDRFGDRSVRQRGRTAGKRYENPDDNASFDDGFVDYRSKRDAERKTPGRRRRN